MRLQKYAVTLMAVLALFTIASGVVNAQTMTQECLNAYAERSWIRHDIDMTRSDLETAEDNYSDATGDIVSLEEDIDIEEAKLAQAMQNMQTYLDMHMDPMNPPDPGVVAVLQIPIDNATNTLAGLQTSLTIAESDRDYWYGIKEDLEDELDELYDDLDAINALIMALNCPYLP